MKLIMLYLVVKSSRFPLIGTSPQTLLFFMTLAVLSIGQVFGFLLMAQCETSL